MEHVLHEIDFAAGRAAKLVQAQPASRLDSTLAGFEHCFATVHGIRIHYVRGGKIGAAPIVLLAGFPESWFAWRKLLPLLASDYEIIAPDLPGQGDSDRPQDGYDSRTLASTVHALLQQLEVNRYCLAAHDVGAWVAYSYAHLFGNEIRRLVLMDAGIPGITLPDELPIAPDRAWRTWHFAFHALPDLPEILIGGRERAYLEWFLRRKTANPETFSDADINEYLRIFLKEGGLRAGLGFYRSAALSGQQNRDLSAKGSLRMPVLALGSDQGSIADMAVPLRPFAENLRGATITNCGHFLPEEQPEAVALELKTFFEGPFDGAELSVGRPIL